MVNHDNVLDGLGYAIEQEHFPLAATGVRVAEEGGPAVGGVTAGVLKELRRGGMPLKSVVAWLPVVLKLIFVVGPKVAEIVRLIREAVARGQTPATFKVPKKH